MKQEMTRSSVWPIRYHGVLLRVFLCLGFLGVLLYAYLDTQNEITRRRLEIPLLMKELAHLKQSNTCLQYQIDRFESPENLMRLARRSEYAHLKQPLLKEILVVQQGTALHHQTIAQKEVEISLPARLRWAIGANTNRQD